MVELDIMQVGVNALAAGFGMGMANEIYHKFAEYRKLLKQRLLDDTIAAIAYYRQTKELDRFTNLDRFAKTPAINPIVRVSKPMPVKPTPVHRIALFRPQFNPKITIRQANVAPDEEPPLTYSAPDYHEAGRDFEEPLSRMVRWETPQTSRNIFD